MIAALSGVVAEKNLNDAVIDDEKLMLGDNALLEEGVIKLSVGKKRHALIKPV